MPTDTVINRFDTQDVVGIGIDLPLMSGNGSSFAINYTTMDQAEANAKNLLLTNKGERIMQPNFGCDLYRALYDNITEVLIDSIDERIRDQFAYWLPYIVINELTIGPNKSDSGAANKLFIKMVISLKNNLFDTRSIELTISQNSNEFS